MREIRYAADKPENCEYCYFYEGKRKGCVLKEENCYYILPPKPKKKEKDPCAGCPYGVDHPCIGFCMNNIMDKGER